MSTEHPSHDHDAFEEMLAEGAGSCPHPELVAAARQGVLSQEIAAPVLRHVDHCDLCSTLLPAADELLTLTAERQAHIRARVKAQPASPQRVAIRAPSRSTLRRWTFVAVAGLAAALGIVAVAVHRRAAPATQSAVTPSASDGGRASALKQLAELEALPPPEPNSADLVTRGDDSRGATKPSAAELLPAFRAYNSGNYIDATRLFGTISAHYPHAELPRLYLGIAQLELKQDATAEQTLLPLTASSTPSPDALWYAGAAAARAQDFATSARLFGRLCASYANDARHRNSCEIAKALMP